MFGDKLEASINNYKSNASKTNNIQAVDGVCTYISLESVCSLKNDQILKVLAATVSKEEVSTGLAITLHCIVLW